MAQKFTAAEIVFKLTGDSTGLDKETKKAEKKVKGLGKRIKGISNLIKGSIATAAIVGIGRVSKELVRAASEAEETRNKFNVTFRDVAIEAQNSASILANSYGLSQQASEKLLSNTGDLLSGFGFTGKAALDLSTKVNTLAVDLGSFANISSERASEALTKALLGETESAKSLGIVIRQNTQEFRDNIKELVRTQGLTEQQAKAQEIYRQAVSQSQNAIGDFARSQESYANQTKILQANIENLATSLGNKLLPSATKAAKLFNSLLDSNDGLDDTVNDLVSSYTTYSELLAITEDKTKNVTIAQKALNEANAAGAKIRFLENIKELNDNYGKQLPAIRLLRNERKKLNAETKENTKRIAEARKANDEYVKVLSNGLEPTISLSSATDFLVNRSTRLAAINEEIDDIQQRRKDSLAALVQFSRIFGKEALLQIIKDKKLRATLEKRIETDEKIRKSSKGKKEAVEAETVSLDKLATKLAFIENKEATLGDRFDENKAKLALYQEELDKALEESGGKSTEQIEKLIEKVDEYNSKVSDSEPWEQASQNIGLAVDVASSLSNLIGALSDNRVEGIEAEQEAELAKAEELGLSEEELADKKKAINEKFQKEKAKEEYKGALVAWGLQSAIAASQAANAILTAYNTVTPYEWPGTVTTAAIAGAINVAAQLASKPKKPVGFANGGIVNPSAGGETFQVAENGSSELLFNQSESGKQFIKDFEKARAEVAAPQNLYLDLYLDDVLTVKNIKAKSRNREFSIDQVAIG